MLGIARRLGIARGTVYRYLRLPAEKNSVIRPRHVSSILDPFLPYLSERWAAGCRNGLQLWREVRERGYPGSRKMVAVWVQHQRDSPAPTMPKKYTQQQCKRKHKCKAAIPPRTASSRLFSWFLLRESRSLCPAEQATLAQIHEAAPELAAAQPLVQQFRSIVNERAGAAAFYLWRKAAWNSGLPDLKNFVVGLDKDREAVIAGLCLQWSNGQVEGQVNRL